MKIKKRPPITIRLTDAAEKRVRVFAIERDISLSDALRLLVNHGLAAVDKSEAALTSTSPPTKTDDHRRRTLSRGV